ncbi:MAG: ABC transporter ATP-binding protein [Chloroflexota bacterium]
MELKIENISKRYGRNKWGLRNFSLTLRPGIIGLLGPNGAGKSTLMNILATLLKPTEGQVLWNGKPIKFQPNRIRSVVGYLPQDFGVYPQLTAIEFLRYMAAIKGVRPNMARRRIDELVSLLNLAQVAHRPLSGYSGGMRQRVGIAQALLNDPKLLIVDEPTVGLDPGERVRFRNLIADLAGDRIILLSTHIVSDVEAIATQIALINGGQLLGFDSPEAILRAATGKVWDWCISAERLPRVRQQHLISNAVRRQNGLHVRVLQPQAPASNAQPARPTLEDAYMLLTTGGAA